MCVVHIQNIAYLDINSTRSQKVNRNANVSVSMARSALGKHELKIMYDVKSTLTRVCNFHSSSVDGVFHK